MKYHEYILASYIPPFEQHKHRSFQTTARQATELSTGAPPAGQSAVSVSPMT